MINKKYNLAIIISIDIIKNGLMPLFLLILIIISAIFVINISYEHRLLITKKYFLIKEKEQLDTEWRNLTLEKIILENPNRIEEISTKKLHMIHINKNNEHIIINK